MSIRLAAEAVPENCDSSVVSLKSVVKILWSFSPTESSRWYFPATVEGSSLMNSAPKYIPHYKVDDYCQWKGNWELIDGVAIAMTPSPFGPHERIIARLSFQIQSQLRSADCPCQVYTNLDWIIKDDTVIRPDLMAVCGEQPERHLESRPEIAVEVLWESTRGLDLTTKRTLCREHDVPHYLIIDPDSRTVEQVSGEESTTDAIDDHFNLMLTDAACCRITISCSTLFD